MREDKIEFLKNKISNYWDFVMEEAKEENYYFSLARIAENNQQQIQIYTFSDDEEDVLIKAFIYKGGVNIKIFEGVI